MDLNKLNVLLEKEGIEETVTNQYIFIMFFLERCQHIGNLINLIDLRLGFNDLTGSIPSTIGNLSNLTNIELDDNNFSGIVPDEICNLGGIEFNTGWIQNNQLCPPYPSCIEDTMGDQDTSNCN